MNRTETNFIYPGDESNLNYWAAKWHVSKKEINEAILQTGSLNPETIHTWLTRDSWLYHPATGLKEIFKSTVNYIF